MGRRLSLPALIAAVVLSVPFLSGPASAAEEPMVDLRVSQGDTLEALGKRYLEKQADWREVARVNRLKNPHLIRPGATLRIPVRLMPGVPVDGTVTFLKGEVRKRTAESDSWTPVRQGDKVRQGTSLATAKASTVEVRFPDGASVFLRPDTTLQIRTALMKGERIGVSRFFLEAGRIVSRIRSAAGVESRYEVSTPSAVAAARGTEFRVSADAVSATRVEVLESRADVAAAGKAVAVQAGEGTVVAKNATPAPPVKLLAPPSLPVLSPIYKEFPVTVSWSAAPGASAVRALLSRDPDGKDTAAEALTPPGGPFAVAGLPDGTYFLFLQSVDAAGLEGPASAPQTVKIRTNPLPPFLRLSEDQAETIGKTAAFSWLKVSDAVRYRVQAARDADFRNIVADRVTDSPSLEISAPDYGDYVLRVCSVASDGYEGGWSVPVKFRLIPPPPTPPLAKPAVSDKTITLGWRDLGAPYTYRFQMSREADFKTLLKDERLTKAEVRLDTPTEPGTYYVRVCSLDGKGREGAFSAPQSFEIERNLWFIPAGVLGAVLMVLIFH